MYEPSSEDKILAGFSHLMIVFGWIGTAVSLVIWFVKKDKSEFVKKSVKQAIAYQIIALTILQLVSLIYGDKAGMAVSLDRCTLIPQAPGPAWAVVAVGFVLYGGKGAISAFQGKNFRYALIGKFVDNILN